MTANPDIVADRRVAGRLRTDTKGMNCHEDFEIRFDVVYSRRICSTGVRAGSGLSITKRGVGPNLPGSADTTAME